MSVRDARGNIISKGDKVKVIEDVYCRDTKELVFEVGDTCIVKDFFSHDYAEVQLVGTKNNNSTQCNCSKIVSCA